MEVEMPYGKININSQDEAVRFILRACTDCFQKTGNDCSGFLATKCNEKKREVLDHFSK